MSKQQEPVQRPTRLPRPDKGKRSAGATGEWLTYADRAEWVMDYAEAERDTLQAQLTKAREAFDSFVWEAKRYLEERHVDDDPKVNEQDERYCRTRLMAAYNDADAHLNPPKEKA